MPVDRTCLRPCQHSQLVAGPTRLLPCKPCSSRRHILPPSEQQGPQAWNSRQSYSQQQGAVACRASRKEEPPVQGYTPANYISYTDGEQHRCHHMVAVEVNAPASVCYSIWNDWTRLVDFMDLVAQIGLDPAEPDLGLFQCFYRWGRMPVMEIVFLARRVKAVENEHLAFETIWGLPAKGDVRFIPGESGSSTTVIFRFEHQLPWLLVDLKVGVFGVEAQMRDIFTENLEEFRKLAEAEAAQQPPQQQQQRAQQQRQPQQQQQRQRTPQQHSPQQSQQQRPGPQAGGAPPPQQQQQRPANGVPSGQGSRASPAPPTAAPFPSRGSSPRPAQRLPVRSRPASAEPSQGQAQGSGGMRARGSTPRGRTPTKSK